MNERDELQFQKEMCVREIYRLVKSLGEGAKLNFSNPELEAACVRLCADKVAWCMDQICKVKARMEALAAKECPR